MMLTAVTTPSIGAVSVARSIWAVRSWRCFRASDTWVSALLRAIVACRMAAVPDASARFWRAIVRLIPADSQAAVASASWRLRSVVLATARTVPFLTVSPTLTASLETVQVVDPAALLALAPARCGATPKDKPYDTVVARAPVAATSSVTLPVVAALVR